MTEHSEEVLRLKLKRTEDALRKERLDEEVDELKELLDANGKAREEADGRLNSETDRAADFAAEAVEAEFQRDVARREAEEWQGLHAAETAKLIVVQHEAEHLREEVDRLIENAVPYQGSEGSFVRNDDLRALARGPLQAEGRPDGGEDCPLCDGCGEPMKGSATDSLHICKEDS